MIQIFLSHNTRDREWGEWLLRSAAAHGIRPYLAEHNVKAGGVLASKIEQAIDNSAAVVVLITDNSVNSVYVQQEIGYARKAKKLIVPVVQLGITSEQLGMLQGVEYISFDFDSPHDGHAQLAAATHRQCPTSVHQMRRSGLLLLKHERGSRATRYAIHYVEACPLTKPC
jgi:TIR domain-containing protein